MNIGQGLVWLRAMPILAEGKLVGLLTAQDISEAYRLLSASPRLLEAGRPY